MFRQHSWESGSSWVGEGAVRALLSAELSDLRNEIQWKIIPMCDPDGVARGGVRFNYKGYDLNRNWDVVDPEMPEITAQRKAVADWIRWDKRLICSFRSTTRKPPSIWKDRRVATRIQRSKPWRSTFLMRSNATHHSTLAVLCFSRLHPLQRE